MGFLSGALDAVKGVLGGGGAQGIGGGISSIVGGFIARGSIKKAVEAYTKFSERATEEEQAALDAALRQLERTYPKEVREVRRGAERAIKELRRGIPRATEAEQGLRREAAISEAGLTPAQRTALEDLSRENAAALASAGARGAGRAGIAAKFDAERRFRENALEANRTRRLSALGELGGLQSRRQALEAGVRGDIAGVQLGRSADLQNIFGRRGQARSSAALGKGESRAAHNLRLADLEFGGALEKGKATQQIAGGATSLFTNVLGGLAGAGIFEEGGPVRQTGPAFVHRGEHVFTDEAVRGAGGGNPRLGHMRLEDMMENLEQRGDPGSMAAIDRVMIDERKRRLRRTSVD